MLSCPSPPGWLAAPPAQVGGSTPAQLSLTPSITCLTNQCGFRGVFRPPCPLGNPGKLSFYS